MKQSLLLTCLLCATCLFSQYNTMSDAELQSKAELKENTLVYQFDQKLVPSHEVRSTNRNRIRERKQGVIAMIETAAISDRQRRVFMRDVHSYPFTERLQKFIEETEEECASFIAAGQEQMPL